ncbi:hypothetical protein [Methyloglobulus sp.]|uniref:hypothetical protein n=1 Tax=Methyloglobulus sp. TaxID=2518622 RepID=UPI003989F8C6
MNYQRVVLVLAMLTTACGTKFGRDFEKQVDLTKHGITETTTNIEEGLKKSCNETPKVSADADEILRLVSSEDNTVFTVDGKQMGKARQLKVCINSKGEHTVIAEPPGCEAKTEKLKPPYDFPIYEFRYMLAECKAANAPPPTPVKAPTHRKTKRKKH